MKISKKLIANEAILKNRFSSLQKLKKKAEELLDFGIGEDNLIINKKIIKQLKKESNNKNNWCYTDLGEKIYIESYKKFLSSQYLYQFGETRDLALTLGIKTTLNILALLLVDEKDIVISTTPGYNVFSRMCQYLGATVIELPLCEKNDYYPDLSLLDEEILTKTKVIHLNYPNNPTGKVASKEFFLEVITLAKKYDITIINDAAYIDYCFSETNSLMGVSDYENLIELYSASKSFGMTGARLGSIVASKKIIELFSKFKDQIDSGSFKPLHAAHIIAMESNIIAINKKKYENRSKEILLILDKLGIKYKKFEGTFYIFCQCPKYFDDFYISSGTEFSRMLLEKFSIYVIPYNEVRNSFRLSLTYKNDTDPKKLLSRLQGHKFKY